MNRRILLIANPAAAAGRASRLWNRLFVDLEARKLKADHVITEGPGHAISLAREASRNYDVIAAVGGDGTVNEVASGILLAGKTKTALAIIPFGTGNDAAHLLGIRSTEDAANALVSGTTRAMDAIEVRCHDAGKEVTRYALLYAAVGFAGALLKRTTPTVNVVRTPTVAPAAAATVIRTTVGQVRITTGPVIAAPRIPTPTIAAPHIPTPVIPVVRSAYPNWPRAAVLTNRPISAARTSPWPIRIPSEAITCLPYRASSRHIAKETSLRCGRQPTRLHESTTCARTPAYVPITSPHTPRPAAVVCATARRPR